MSVYSSTDFEIDSMQVGGVQHRHGPAIVTRPDGDVSIQPSSVDLHLGDTYGWYGDQKRPVVVSERESYPKFEAAQNDDEITIYPGEFLLAHTDDVIHLPGDAVGFLHGRSSVGRLGLFVHNAGLVDPNFSGDLTLELYNASRNTIALDVGMRICQMTVHSLNSEPINKYSKRNGNKYQGQRGPTPSKLYDDFE